MKKNSVFFSYTISNATICISARSENAQTTVTFKMGRGVGCGGDITVSNCPVPFQGCQMWYEYVWIDRGYHHVQFKTHLNNQKPHQHLRAENTLSTYNKF